MLSASFSIVSQLSHLRSFPSVGMKHTDEAQIGQIYIPVVNYALGIAIVGVVAGFKTSTGLTSAYGLAVMSVAFITTVSKDSVVMEICLDLAADVFLLSFLRGSFAQTEVALQIYFVKNRPWILAIVFLAFFGFIDGLLWGATLRKVVLGAWFSLSVGVASESRALSKLESKTWGADRPSLSYLIYSYPLLHLLDLLYFFGRQFRQGESLFSQRTDLESQACYSKCTTRRWRDFRRLATLASLSQPWKEVDAQNWQHFRLLENGWWHWSPSFVRSLPNQDSSPSKSCRQYLVEPTKCFLRSTSLISSSSNYTS